MAVPFDFPDSPTLNEEVVAVGGIVYIWDGIKWISGVAPMVYLPIAGGTMTGPLILARDPQLPMEAVTMQWVENYVATHATVAAGSNTQIQYNDNGAFGASGNLVWDDANERLGIGTSAPVANLDVVAPNMTTVLIGNPAQAGTMYLLATTGLNLGLVDLVTNATWDGSLWNQIDPVVSSWDIGMRDSTAAEVTYPSLWSIRFMAPGDPPGLFPTSRLAITRAGNVGIGTDSAAYRMDIMGDCNLAAGSVYRIGGVPISYSPPIVAGTCTTVGTSGANVTVNVNRSCVQTPWATNINGGNFNLSNVGSIAIDSSASGAITNWSSMLDMRATGSANFLLFGISLDVQGYSSTFADQFIPINIYQSQNNGLNAPSIRVYNTASAGQASTQWTVNPGPGRARTLYCGISGPTAPNYANTGFIEVQSNSLDPAYPIPLVFLMNSVEKMRLIASQNDPPRLGIGATNPMFTLDVRGMGIAHIGTGIPSGVLPANAPNFAWLLVGANDDDGTWGISTTYGNASSTGLPVGSFAFANYRIAGAEKRIAEITASGDASLDSGRILFNVADFGALTQQMSISRTGVRIGRLATTSDAGDLGVARDSGGGAIFFGTTGAVYLYFDGSNFNINCPGTLVVNGVPI